MSAALVKPNLDAGVVRRPLEDGSLLLQHDDHRTQLEISPSERASVEQMDGSRSLEELEAVLPRSGGALGYEALVVLLYRLWDRGLLANGDDVRDALFPRSKARTLDRAVAWRSVRRIFALSLMVDRAGDVLRYLAPAGRALVAAPVLALMLLVGISAAVLVAAGTLPWPSNILRHEGSWLLGIVLAYVTAGVALSARGLARAAVLAGAAGGVQRAGIRMTGGVAYFDVDDLEAYHQSTAFQIRFSLVGVGSIGAIGGGLLLAAAASSSDWLLTAGATTLLLAFVDSCPFLRTSGARLVEALTSVQRQRYRVQSYIGRRLLRALWSSRGHGPASSGLAMVSTLWFLWFFIALRILTAVLLGPMLLLQVALLSSESLPLLIVGGLTFSYLVVLCLAFLGVIAGVSLGLLLQLLLPEGVSAPYKRRRGSSLAPEESAAILLSLNAFPLTKALPEDAKAELSSRAEHQTYRAGAWLVRGTERPARVMAIVRGAVELLRPLPEGGHRRVGSLGPKQTLGLDRLDRTITARVATAEMATAQVAGTSSEAVTAQVAGTSAEPLMVRAIEETEVVSLEVDAVLGIVERSGEGTEGLALSRRVADFLDSVPELAGLTPGGRLELATQAGERRCVAGEQLFRAGDVADSMYLIREGRCRVERSEGGSDVTLAELGVGQAVGEIGVLYDQPRSASVTALEDSVLVELPRAALEDALRRSFHVGLALERLAVTRRGGPGTGR